MKNYKVYQIKDLNDEVVQIGITNQALSRKFVQYINAEHLNRNHYKIFLVQEYLTLEHASVLESMLLAQHFKVKEKLNKSKNKSIMCLETGKIYKSAREAAKDLNLNYSKISLVCNGIRPTTGKLHFKFV